ncbi:hypothetical protein KJ865_01175 [Myxococcota bacterium]|nr:hypothetical protein [Myxococcota bacterium]
MEISLFLDNKKAPLRWHKVRWIPRAGFSFFARAGAKVKIIFRTKLPRRYGPLGCVESACILGAPWYPQYHGVIDDHPPPGASQRAFFHRVSLSTAKKKQPLFLGRAGVSTLTVFGSELFFPAAAGDHFQTSCQKGFCLFHTSSLKSPFRFLTGERLFEVVRTCKKTIKRLAPLPANFTMWLIETPLREELTMTLPRGALLFSDRSFHLLPLEYFLKFHRQSLARGIRETILSHNLAHKETPASGRWVSEMISTFFARYAKSVRGLLETFEWIPQIDLVLKNPRMEFRSSFFQGPDDKDSLRHDYRRWNNTQPMGNRLFYKLHDLFGEKELGEIIAGYLKSPLSFKKYLQKRTGLDFSWFFSQWLMGDYLVDYSVARVKRIRAKKGFYGYRITIVRKSSRPITEPVIIKITDSGDREVQATWLGKGTRHTFDVTLKSPVAKVHVDPDGDLSENSTTDDPLYNNVWPSPGWRFIFSGFVVLFNVTEMLNKFYMDADLLPRNSLRRRLNILTYRDEIIEGGFALAHLQYFGPVVNNSRLAYRWDLGTGFGKTRAIMGPDNNQRASKYTVFTAFNYNGREDFMLPTKKGWANLLASANTYTSDHTVEGSSTNFELLTEGSRYFALPLGMSFAAHMKAAAKLGPVHDEVELLRLSGPGKLQGYEVDHFPGRLMGIGALEVRHIIYPSSDLTLFGAVNLTRLSGAFYLGGGVISGGMDGPYTDNFRWGASVGYGIRIHGKWFGVYEGVVNLQVSWPLKKYPETREPFIFFISLEPLF